MLEPGNRPNVRRYATPLTVLSVLGLIVTTWIFLDVSREREIVERIIGHLPPGDVASAIELSGDLRLQWALSVLLALNIIGTAIASVWMIRGYATSERSLREVKGFANDILASMDAGVITTDQSGVITSMNPRATELIGSEQSLSSNSLIGKSLAQLPSSHQLLDQICTEVREYHTTIRDRDYVVVQQGHPQTLRAGSTLLKNQRGEQIGTVIHVRDVSAKALMEDRLRRMERYMGLGPLAAGLRHEIKNPLSALSLHIQLLHERLLEDSPDDEVREMLDILRVEVKRINDVLDGFNNYASLEQLGRSPVDVSKLIDKLVRLLRPQTDTQSIEIRWVSKNDFRPKLEADSIRLEQVLLNLALNAIESMPEGGLLEFELEQTEQSVWIHVSDSGTGIPETIRSQIFDPYFTTRNNGTGMGLALCEKIIRQHDGRIHFRTSIGGTTFMIELPLKEEK